jgi:hypothetical protein
MPPITKAKPKAQKKVTAGHGFLAVLGVITLVLGQATAALDNIDKLRSKLVDWFDLSDFFAVHEAIKIGAAVLVATGVALLAYWAYDLYFRQRAGGWKVAAVILGIVAIPLSGLLTYRALTSPTRLDLVRDQTRLLTSAVEEQQVNGGPADGGFRFSPTGGSNDVQAWTSAQCLLALISEPLSESQRGAARRALAYLERTRIPDKGWGYMPESTVGVTEVNAWVTLAEIQAFKTEDLIRPDEQPGMLARVFRDLAELQGRQHSDGGWGPLSRTSREADTRTYSTVIAVWALIEARQNTGISSDPRWTFDQAIKDGVRWVISHYQDNSGALPGWYPNPTVSHPAGNYIGLTAQTLFVIHRAQREFPDIAANVILRQAQDNFLKMAANGSAGYPPLRTQAISDNARMHDTDTYLPGIATVLPDVGDFHIEPSTFLWYPWTLLALNEIATDEADDRDSQRRATSLIRILVGRAGEAVQFATHDEAIYPSAEILFAFDRYRASQPRENNE